MTKVKYSMVIVVMIIRIKMNQTCKTNTQLGQTANTGSTKAKLIQLNLNGKSTKPHKR